MKIFPFDTAAFKNLLERWFPVKHPRITEIGERLQAMRKREELEMQDTSMDWPISESFEERTARILTEETKTPLRWFYCSFAEDAGFLGAALVQAHGVVSASLITHRLGINPGGELLAVDISGLEANLPPESYRNRLLSKAEILALWPDSKSLAEHEADDEAEKEQECKNSN